jgi:hypothetical protein
MRGMVSQINYPVIFRDHDAQDAAEYEACGIRTVPAPMGKNVMQGIDMVRRRFVDGKLFFVKGHTPNLIREIGQYVWPSGTRNRDAIENPVAKMNHALDALRYLVTGLDYSDNPGTLLDMSIFAKP